MRFRCHLVRERRSFCRLKDGVKDMLVAGGTTFAVFIAVAAFLVLLLLLTQ